MTKPQLTRFLVVVLITLLGTQVLAAPRVGLLTLEKGTVTVDGVPLRTPVLLEEGQTVILKAGARAKVKILGSTQERILEGDLTLKASKSTLEKDSQTVQRGTVALAQDMGNVTKGAASVTRNSGFSLATTVPTRNSESGDYEFIVSSRAPSGKSDPKKFYVNIAILEPRTDVPNKQDHKTVYSKQMEHDFGNGPLVVSGLSSEFAESGRRYRLSFTDKPNDNLNFLGLRRYRVLTSEERDFLKELDSDARFQADDEQSIYPLLHLASVYNELDQVEEALSLLKEIVANPTLSREPDSTGLRTEINAEITRLESYLPGNSPALSSTPER